MKHPRIQPRPGEREPAFLDDTTATVSLAEVRASIAFERGTRQHATDLREAREARNAPKSREKR